MAQGIDLDHTPPAPGHQRLHTLPVRIGVGLLSGLVLIAAFAWFVNLHAAFRRLEHLNVEFALLSGVVFLGAYVVRALRWRCFLAPDRVGVLHVVALYQVAIFINWLLPVRAGELAKSLLLRRSTGIAISRSLATITMDKAMDLLPAVGLVAFLPLMQLHLSRPLWLLLLSTLTVLGLGALLLGLLAWRRDRTLAWTIRLVVKILPAGLGQRVEPFIVRFIDTLLAIIRQPRLLLLTTAYTAVAVSLDALFCLLAFRAVGVPVSFLVVLYGFTFFNLAYILPTPPGQIGSNEVIGLLIFSGLFGVSRSGVGAMFLFSHPWTAILMATSGTLCLSAMGLTLRSTLGLNRQIGQEGN